jgi:anhydro-N-acetylmuramic acid kinase
VTAPRDAVLVGVMSGTSLDGVTATVARYRAVDGGRYGADLLAVETLPYDEPRRARLRAAVDGGTAEAYARLHHDVGHWCADAALAALAQAGVPRADIAAVASHGQTLWHAPPHATWQVGSAAVIAERTGLPVIHDFRARDVAAGGQGAPLVPIADCLLFAAPDHWRVLLNLGGMANLTVVPAGGGVPGTRAFDTGPGVAVIDAVTRRLAGAPFDRDGAIAAAGRAVEAVVAEWLAAPWFATEPPRSTGREQFGEPFAETLIERVRAVRPDAAPADVIATATALTVRSIADAVRRFLPEPVTEVVVSGGGARNRTVMTALAAALAPRAVTPFDAVFFDGDAKEAVAFGFLGFLHLRGEPGNVPAATGARGPRVLGSRTPA